MTNSSQPPVTPTDSKSQSFSTIDVDLSHQEQCQLVDLFAQQQLSPASYLTYTEKRNSFLLQGIDSQQARERALYYACLNQSIQNILQHYIDQERSSSSPGSDPSSEPTVP